ncbi:hydrophobic surface binding protein A-domain-containing protein [Leptodontidium sp. 2 PMI_412]|nr:hydrophobic surface binding protein A-domain-containing protein [Leptodontidium sp. 2 PMI_412]
MHITTAIFLLSCLFTSISSSKSSPTFFSGPHSIPGIEVGSQLLKRDVTPIVTGISSIRTLVSTLTTTATIYSGSLTETLGLASTVGELEIATAKATMDVGSEEVLDEDGSETVVSSVGDLASGIRNLLQNLAARAPVIAEAGYTAVANELKSLKRSTDAFLVALERKVVIGDVDEMKASQETVREAFGKAVAAFSSPAARHNIFSSIGFGLH